eukprot:TRINITY_DN43790_c0_g1_i1.p1 TRINITY_DN43790_c0_g1~~TRINITY_DN43790_c0_g1_i1.p1  ORF type:complete len:175 (+),score=48.89 TRINITY_DN43790_c0_g1_i1:276-800(+)
MSSRRIEKAVIFLQTPQGRAALAAEMLIPFFKNNAGLDDAEIAEALKRAGVTVETSGKRAAASPGSQRKRRKQAKGVGREGLERAESALEPPQQREVSKDVSERVEQWIAAPQHVGIPKDAMAVVKLLPLLVDNEEQANTYWSQMSPSAQALASSVWKAVEKSAEVELEASSKS